MSLIAARAALTGGRKIMTPYVMTNAPQNVSGFRVPWANGTDSSFKIELGIYVPKTSHTIDGDWGYLRDLNYPLGYRIFMLTFDSTENKTGFSIDTDTSDMGRRTCWQGDWWPTKNLGDYRGVPCHIVYRNSDRSAAFAYGGTTYTNCDINGSKSAIYPSEVYVLNGVSNSYEHGLLYIRYISGQGTTLHDYVPVQTANGVKLKDKVTGLEYSPDNPSYYYYGEIGP